MIEVLFTDDEKGMLRLGKDYLEASGKLRVEMTGSVREALKKLADHRFDAIVSDYLMPDIDGLEFLKTVRGTDDDIPFILFTGHGREEVVIQALDLGVSGYMEKGYDNDSMFAELEHRILQAVYKREAEEELQIKKLQANLAMDLAKIASWELDMKTGMFEFDDIFFSLYGTNALQEGGHVFSPESYVTKFVHPEDRDRVMSWIGQGEQAIGPLGYGEIEHRIIRRDGEVRWIVVRVGMFKNCRGRVIKVYGINQDITERKSGETS